MSHEYVIEGTKVITVDPMTDPQKAFLGKGLKEARRRVHDALIVTQQALGIVADLIKGGLSADKAIGFLDPEFRRHIEWHFQLDTPESMLLCLSNMNSWIQALAAGLTSPELRVAQYGYHWFLEGLDRFFTGGGPPVGMVQKPMVQALLEPRDCLNIDPHNKNGNDLVLDFSQMRDSLFPNFVDTIIHECTHKYLNTKDICKNQVPFGQMTVKEYCDMYAGMGTTPTAGNLERFPTLTLFADAYVLTSYIYIMPKLDLISYMNAKKFVAGVDRVIGGATSNRAVFDAVGNESL